MNGDTGHYQFVIDDAHAGQRLDQFLLSTGLFSSRGRVQACIEQGEVTCNGEPVKKAGQKLRLGQVIVCSIASLQPNDQLIPDPSPIDILYQDDAIVVLNKPVAVCVHAGAGNPHGTLVERLMGHGISLSPIGLPLRPGVVHRLDKGTSGVMVWAKTEVASHHLISQFANKQVEKIYLAVTIGRLRVLSGTIRNKLGRHALHRQKFSSETRHGKEAISHFRVLSMSETLSLLEIRLETGRTHQIRVHLSEYGYPIVGDEVYGGGMRRIKDLALSAEQHQAAIRLAGPLLHAHRLAFMHPLSGERLAFEVPLPEHFQPFINLEQASNLWSGESKG